MGSSATLLRLPLKVAERVAGRVAGEWCKGVVDVGQDRLLELFAMVADKVATPIRQPLPPTLEGGKVAKVAKSMERKCVSSITIAPTNRRNLQRHWRFHLQVFHRLSSAEKAWQ